MYRHLIIFSEVTCWWMFMNVTCMHHMQQLQNAFEVVASMQINLLKPSVCITYQQV